jgi:hypothetical protein
MKLQVDEITRDVLDELEEQWEQTRLKNLVRDEVVSLGRRLTEARVHQERVEGQCMIRARKLFMLGFDRQEIGELFDVTRAQVNKWTKGMD